MEHNTTERLRPVIKELPDSLVMTEGLRPAFMVLQLLLNTPDSPHHSLAVNTLHAVQEIVRTNEKYDNATIFEALTPMIEAGLEDTDLQVRSNSILAFVQMTERGYHPGSALKLIIKYLQSNDRQMQHSAVLVVYECANHGHDVADALQGLERALTAEDPEIRAYASQAISYEFMRQGKETDLALDPAVFDRENLDTGWTVSLGHRRRYALNDSPFNAPTSSAGFVVNRTCGVCGHDSAVCIWYQEEAGKGWTHRVQEYLCPKCGKYTVYRYMS